MYSEVFNSLPLQWDCKWASDRAETKYEDKFLVIQPAIYPKIMKQIMTKIRMTYLKIIGRISKLSPEKKYKHH